MHMVRNAGTCTATFKIFTSSLVKHLCLILSQAFLLHPLLSCISSTSTLVQHIAVVKHLYFVPMSGISSSSLVKHIYIIPVKHLYSTSYLGEHIYQDQVYE
jgi:hypothetical protein